MVLRPGDTLRGGQYEIKSVLGQGGFGITYKAWDRNLKRYVVLKSQNEHLRYDPDYEKYVARFMKEGQIMAKLAAREMHPNLVQLFALFSEPANHHYLMMEFIEGQNLFEAVKARGRLPETEVISIARQIGSALEWMHEHEFVHRDLHPGNIMICPNGKVMLIDLGGAKEFLPSSQSSKGIIGNKGFAPYEQIRDPKDTRHPSADIFGLAGSLYFAVTGSRPTESLNRKLSEATLTPPGQLVSISASLNTMLMAGLELEAADRPQSIDEFLHRLKSEEEPSTSLEETPSPCPDSPTNIPFPSPELLEEISPLSSEPIEEEETVLETEPPVEPKRMVTTVIPWRWLAGCVAAYTIIGIGISIQDSSASWSVAVAAAVAWAVSRAGTEASAKAMGTALTVAVTIAMTVHSTKTLAEALAVNLAGVLAGSSLVSWIVSLTGSLVVTVAGVLVGVLAGSLAWKTRTKVVTDALTWAWIVIVPATIVALQWRSWEFISGYESVFAGVWWVSWPLTLGLLPARAAIEIRTPRGSAIFLPRLAAWVGLAIGWWIYRAVHPA